MKSRGYPHTDIFRQPLFLFYWICFPSPNLNEKRPCTLLHNWITCQCGQYVLFWVFFLNIVFTSIIYSCSLVLPSASVLGCNSIYFPCSRQQQNTEYLQQQIDINRKYINVTVGILFTKMPLIFSTLVLQPAKHFSAGNLSTVITVRLPWGSNFLGSTLTSGRQVTRQGHR